MPHENRGSRPGPPTATDEDVVTARQGKAEPHQQSVLGWQAASGEVIRTRAALRALPQHSGPTAEGLHADRHEPRVERAVKWSGIHATEQTVNSDAEETAKHLVTEPGPVHAERTQRMGS